MNELENIVATSRTWDDVREELDQPLTQDAVSKRLKRAGLSYKELLGSAIGDPVKLAKARRTASVARRELKKAYARVSELEQMVEIATTVPKFSATVKPKRARKPGRRRAAHVLLVSDCHIEETVSQTTTNGHNEYDLKIAKARFRRIFEGQVWLSQYHRQAFDLMGLVWLGGDLISGYIHDELIEGNSLSPTQAIITLREWITEGLELLRSEAGYEQLRVVCSFGNHGRTTAKTHISTAANNSLEFLLYSILASDYQHESDVTFVCEKGHLTYQNVYGTRVRFTHGDSITGGGGISGPSASITRKIAQWDRVDRADLTCLGHFHKFTDGGNFVLNGSLIGYAPFGIWIAASLEAPQMASFLIDETRGKLMVTPVWCDRVSEKVGF